MSTRASKLTVIGTAIGLVLAGAAISPASAVTVATAFPASSCSSFKGATTTGAYPTFSGVAMKRNDTITARVSPASVGDMISLSGNYNGLQLIFGAGSASGYAFQAPVDGYYSLQYSLMTASPSGSTLTWSFDATCSTTSISPSPSPSPTATTKPGKGGGKKP
jgi:hypothetical protein